MEMRNSWQWWSAAHSNGKLKTSGKKQIQMQILNFCINSQQTAVHTGSELLAVLPRSHGVGRYRDIGGQIQDIGGQIYLLFRGGKCSETSATYALLHLNEECYQSSTFLEERMAYLARPCRSADTVLLRLTEKGYVTKLDQVRLYGFSTLPRDTTPSESGPQSGF